MKFCPYLPAPPLRPFLQTYVEADCRDNIGAYKYTLFPNGLSGIFFNFGNTGKLCLTKQYDVAPVSVFGQIDQHFSISHEQGFYSLGVLFKPTKLSKFLRTDISELTNKAADGTLYRADLLVVHEKLQHARYIRHKIDLLNKYFCRMLSNLSREESISDFAVHLINTEAHLTIEQVAARLGFSQRYLEVDFKRSVGLTPKSYSLIQRFIRTEQKLKAQPANSEYLRFGEEYYDQMHLIKDFKRFTGHTPTQYMLEKLETGRSYLVRS